MQLALSAQAVSHRTYDPALKAHASVPPGRIVYLTEDAVEPPYFLSK